MFLSVSPPPPFKRNHEQNHAPAQSKHNQTVGEELCKLWVVKKEIIPALSRTTLRQTASFLPKNPLLKVTIIWNLPNSKKVLIYCSSNIIYNLWMASKSQCYTSGTGAEKTARSRGQLARPRGGDSCPAEKSSRCHPGRGLRSSRCARNEVASRNVVRGLKPLFDPPPPGDELIFSPGDKIIFSPGDEIIFCPRGLSYLLPPRIKLSSAPGDEIIFSLRGWNYLLPPGMKLSSPSGDKIIFSPRKWNYLYPPP